MKWANPLLATCFALASLACSSPESSDAPEGTGGSSTDGMGGDGGTDPSDEMPPDGQWFPNAELGFNTSNFGLNAMSSDDFDDLVVANDCEFGAEPGEVSCAESARYSHSVVNDAYDLYVFQSLTVEEGTSLTISGERPAIIAVFDNIQIDGSLEVLPGQAGGEAPTELAPMGSPGDGDDGGDFCGLGGWGLERSSVQRAPTGSANLSPLLAGHSGGNAPGSLSAGLGGGALQLVAGGSFSISSTGRLTANGGGGLSTSPMRGRPGGGGSGGAILIEAPTVDIRGILTATGGGGGSQEEGADGESGSVSEAPAPGGTSQQNGFGNGGDGSSSTEINGQDGTLNGGEFYGGGGGGAGRIRINAVGGNTDLSDGLISPAPTTKCFSLGDL